MRMAFVFGMAMLAGACAGAAGDGPRWPTSGWSMSTPHTEDMNAAALSAFDAELAAGQHGYVTGMLVIRRGRIVFERTYRHDFDALFEGRDPVRGPYNYYDPDWHPYFQHGALHTMQSVTKSVTSALIGVAIARAELPGVHPPVLSHFPAFRQPSDPRWSAMRLEHVLTMTAGIQWDESTVAYTDPANSCAGMERSEDWVQFVLDQPMASEPGATFRYNSGATQLLSHVIRHTTGLEADEYAERYLFTPLGIREHSWKRTPKGLADTEGGLYLTARDLAKIGYLYLHDGVWEGTRLLPEGWVAASTSPRVETGIGRDRKRKYGYQWWVLPYGTQGRTAYAALGYGGQRLIVVPEHDLIAVFTGWNIYDKPELDTWLALDRVVGAVAPAS